MEFEKLFSRGIGNMCEVTHVTQVPGKVSGGDIPSLHINGRNASIAHTHWHLLNATFLGFHMRNSLGPVSVPFSKSFPRQTPVPVHNGLQY